MNDKHEEAAEALYDSWRYGSAEPTALIQDIAADRRKVERETLERAAKVCEDMAGDAGNWSIRYRCAQAIRALNVSTDNELSTTPELADVSTPVKLIDLEQE